MFYNAPISSLTCYVPLHALQDGIELDLKDKNGKTPYLLAAGRKHDKVIIDKNHSILGKVELK